MDVNKYLNKSYFDIQRGRHRTVEVIASAANSVLLRTDEGKVLKLCDDSTSSSVYNERIEWLQEISKSGKLNDLISLPQTRLTGLKHGEYGYVCDESCEVTLTYYIHPSKEIKPFNKWYYDATGGIEYRLKTGYIIATAIEKIHQLGYCLVDLCPENTSITKYNAEERTLPKVKFLGAENISSYTYHPQIKGSDLYIDPMVYLNRNGNSVTSDTYSYAVMLFELLSTCHPYIGDDCENEEYQNLIELVNSGNLEYIGNDDCDDNKNDTFDMTQLFIPKELKELFYKMFVSGKFSPNERPLIADFKKACLRAIQKLIVCSNPACKREYPYNVNKICPFCNRQTENVVVARVKRKLCSTENILLPYDGKKGFSSLPESEENINYMILKPGLNRLPKSFLDPTLCDDNGASGILIQCRMDVGRYIIRNRFKKTKFSVNGKVLEPFVKKELAEKSDISLPLSKEAIIEFPNNLMMDSEEIADLSCEQYGDIIYKWFITIG